MAGLRPTPRTMSNIKSKLLRPATTSNFECWFYPPQKIQPFFDSKNKAGAGAVYDRDAQELISLSCFDASLPGSSLQTGNLTDSYTGVNETYAYRRAYDNRADFSFYVDNDRETKGYRVIFFFENWIAYVANEQFDPIVEGVRVANIDDKNYFYRFNFPDDYMGKITILKFEKDHLLKDRGRPLQYDFLQAFPISMNSIPVSYDSTQLLKCTVSFSYQRYTIKRGA